MKARTRRRAPARGGKHGWEPPTRVRARAQRVVDLAVKGWSQLDIARELGVSQAAVSKILARADAKALPDMVEHVTRLKVRQTQRLEHLFGELMRAWDQSKADATRRRQRQSDSGDGSGQTIAEVVVEAQYGDPRYMEQMRKVLADLRKVWGVDAPQRVDVRASRTPLDALSETELEQMLREQDRLLRRVLPVPPSSDTEDQ